MLTRLNRTSKHRLAIAAGILGLALWTLSSPTGALAAEEEEEETFEQSIIRNLLGGGSKPSIDYRERSPLVIPPSRDLPAPESATAIDGAPAWPRDPDQRRQAATRSAPAIDGERSAARHLRPDEMRRGTTARERDNRPNVTQSDNDQGRPLRPAEYGETRQLFNFFASQKAEAETFTGEPGRSRMTEPPAGYRTPAPTQPYQAPKDRPGSWFKAFNIFDRGTQ